MSDIVDTTIGWAGWDIGWGGSYCTTAPVEWLIYPIETYPNPKSDEERKFKEYLNSISGIDNE